jgi:hypothetical protein
LLTALVYSGTVLALAMKEILRGYIVEMYDGTKVRFDDGTEAYAYVKTLEQEVGHAFTEMLTEKPKRSVIAVKPRNFLGRVVK